MSATGAVRVGTHRTGTLRTGAARTGTHRTGVVRGGAGRTTAARGAPQRSVPQRSVPQRSVPPRSVPVRPELKVVPPPARARRAGARSWRAPYVLLVLALLVGTTLSLLVLNTAIAVDSLKANELRQQNAHRVQDEQLLRRQVIEGSTPQRIATEATEAGMVPAATPGYLVVQPHGSSLRGAPSPAPAPATPSAAAASPSPSSPAGAAQGQPGPAGGN